MLSGLLNTGYNIYSGNRQYEADRADTQWHQQLQERQYQDSLNQQRYENETSEREYQDKLNQQKFNNDVTSQKLNIAMGEWNLKKNNAAQKASRAGAGGIRHGGFRQRGQRQLFRHGQPQHKQRYPSGQRHLSERDGARCPYRWRC